MIEYYVATTGEDYEAAKLLFKDYAETINIDLSFQHFAEELRDIKKMYSPPEGGICFLKMSMNLPAVLPSGNLMKKLAS